MRDSFPQAAHRARPPRLIIGLGNDCRGDDAVGRVVARSLVTIPSEGVRILEDSGDGAALMDLWADSDSVIIIDAVRSGGESGAIYRIDALAEQLPRRLFLCSTHALGLAEAIELARAMDRLPARLIIYGIEGRDFEPGIGLSPEVERAAREVAARIQSECLQDNGLPVT